MEKRVYKQKSFRIDRETEEKLQTIAFREGRTPSMQVLYWVRRAIERYEVENAEGTVQYSQ